jgi:anti-sigma-K factor RskA
MVRLPCRAVLVTAALEVLERRQAERRRYAGALAALIERRERELVNLRATQAVAGGAGQTLSGRLHLRSVAAVS